MMQSMAGDAAVPEEKEKMTSAAAAVDVDDMTDPSNGDCAAVSFQPAPAAAAAAVAADPSHLTRSSSGESTARRAAVVALSSNDAQRPAAEVTSATASSTAEEEERELFIWAYTRAADIND